MDILSESKLSFRSISLDRVMLFFSWLKWFGQAKEMRKFGPAAGMIGFITLQQSAPSQMTWQDSILCALTLEAHFKLAMRACLATPYAL